MTTKQIYRKFLNEHFKGLKLRKPLFYSWDFGLRFDLQVGDTNTEEYFREVTRRATTIFQAAFNHSDEMLVVLIDYKYKRSKIRFSNFTFKQINQLQKTEISYAKISRLYQSDDKFDKRNVAIIKLTPDRINYKNIIRAIGHIDFPSWQPRLDKSKSPTGKEIYFINMERQLIFNMYDDRGLDLIAANKETLRPIYEKYNDWILDYDRQQIDSEFG